LLPSSLHNQSARDVQQSFALSMSKGVKLRANEVQLIAASLFDCMDSSCKCSRTMIGMKSALLLQR